MTAALATLNPAALVALTSCEQRIERGLKTFIDVGQALAEIRDSRLYKGTHETFEAYCRDRWKMTDGRARQLMIAAATVTNVAVGGLPTPTNEGQARALAAVPEAERAGVWRDVVESGEKPTAAAIRKAAEARTQPAEPEPEHYHVGGSAGGPGENSAECACGLVLDGFDSHAEVMELLDDHIQTPEPAAPVDVPTVAAGSGPDLKAKIRANLAEIGAEGTTRGAIRLGFRRGEVDDADITDAIRELLTDGEISIVGESIAGTLFALTELITQTPEPAELPSTAPAGSGSTSPAPPEDLRDQVLAVLRPDEDDAWGLEDICERLPGFGEPGQVRPGQIREVLAELVAEGLAGVGQDVGGPYWWKVPPKLTPAERIAAVAEVAPEFVRPVEPDPAALVNAALDQHVPDRDAPKRAWARQFDERLKPIGSFTLWLDADVDEAARFATDDDVETLRQLSLSLADLHRRVVAARTATVTPLRRIK